MDLDEFAARHLPALGGDEVRFDQVIGATMTAVKEKPPGFRHWTLGGPGHCAIQRPGRAILLGNLDVEDCRELARVTMAIDYAGVIGSGEAPRWFVEHATALGARFEDPLPHRIHVLSDAPRYPGVAGSPRTVTAADVPLLFEWITAFCREALPHETPPDRASAETGAASGRHLFWTVDGVPVSMAAVTRRLRRTGAISLVYTPPEHRGQGYAGSATAAVAERLFAEGMSSVSLHTDLRNPVSNRCYAKIGFTPHCDAWHYLRRA